MIVGCTGEGEDFGAELRAVVAQGQLDVALDGRVVEERTLRSQCYNPGFDRESPTIDYSLPTADGSEAALVDDLARRAAAQGWSVTEVPEGTRFTGQTDGRGFTGFVSPESPGFVNLMVRLDADWTC